MPKLNDLEQNIRQWGIDRNITLEGGATVQSQASKGLEEMAEMFQTLGERHKILNMTNPEWILDEKDQEDFDANVDRLNELHDKLKDDIGDVVVCMIQAARLAGTDLTECVEQSWNDIKDRKGTMRNGKFYKEV